MLAPFGAGNPSLTMATRGVKLKSVSTIGKAKEHLRLTVEDENGRTQGILWWGGAGEELSDPSSPLRVGSTFDIAYSLRASSFRGQKQVTLQLEEFRVTEEQVLEIHKSKLEVVDWRLQSGKWQELENVLVWAEGADKANGKPRSGMTPSDELVIYTTPPSLTELRAALEIVKPKKVYIIGVSPASLKADEFLSQLAGLVKYAINNKGGKISIKELASVTTQRESVIRIGLEWLAAGGHVTVSADAGADAVLLSAGNGEADQYVQKELFIAVKGILEETAAYRAYFSRASIDAIMG